MSTSALHPGVDRTIVADAMAYVQKNQAAGEAKLTPRQAEALIAKAKVAGDLDTDTLDFIKSLTSEANAAKFAEVSQKTAFKADGLTFEGQAIALTPVQSETLDAVAAGYEPSGNAALDAKVLAADKRIEAILNANPPLPPMKLEQELAKLAGEIGQLKAAKNLPPATRAMLDAKLAEVAGVMKASLTTMAKAIDPGAKVEDLTKAFAQFDTEAASFKALAGKLGIDFAAIDREVKVTVALVVDAAMGKLAERGTGLAGGKSVSMNQLRAFTAEVRLLAAEAKKYGVPLAEDRTTEVKTVERAVVAKRIETLNQSLQTMLAAGKGDIRSLSGLLEEFRDLGGYWNDPALKPMMVAMKANFTSLINDGIASTGLLTDPDKMSADQVKAATGFVAVAAQYDLPIKGTDGKDVSGTDVKAKLEKAGMSVVKKDFEQAQSFFLVVADGLQKGDPEAIVKGAKLISAVLQDPTNPMYGMVTKMLQDPKAKALYNASLLVAGGSSVGSVNKAIDKLGITGFNNLTEKVLLSPQNMALPADQRLTVGKLMSAVDLSTSKYKEGAGYLHDMAKNKTDHYVVGFAMTLVGAKNPAELTDAAVKMELDASDMEIKMWQALKNGDMDGLQTLLVDASDKSSKALQAAKGEWEGDINKAENIVKWLERVKTASDVVGLALGLPGLVKLGGTMLVRGGAMAIVKNPAAVEWVLATAGKTGLKAAGTEAASLAAKEVLATEGRWAATKVFETAFVKTALPTFAEWGATLSKPFVAASGAMFSEVGIFRTVAADVGLGVVQMMDVDKDGKLGIHLKDDKGKVKWFDIATTVGGVALSVYGFKASKVKHVDVPDGVKLPEGKAGGVHEGGKPVEPVKVEEGGKPIEPVKVDEGGKPPAPTVTKVEPPVETTGTVTVEKPVDTKGPVTVEKPVEPPVKTVEKPPASDASVKPVEVVKPVEPPKLKAGDEIFISDGSGNVTKGKVESIDATGEALVEIPSPTGGPPSKNRIDVDKLVAMQAHPSIQELPTKLFHPGEKVTMPDGATGEVSGAFGDRVFVKVTGADGKATETMMGAKTLMGHQPKVSAEEFAKTFPHGGEKETWVRTRNDDGSLGGRKTDYKTDLWKVEAHDPKSGMVELSQTHTKTPLVKSTGELEGFKVADAKALKEGDIVIDETGKAWKVEQSLAANNAAHASEGGVGRVVLSRTEIKRVSASTLVADAKLPDNVPTVITGRAPGKETTWKQSLKDDLEVVKAKFKPDSEAIHRVGAKAVTIKPATTDPAYTFHMNAVKPHEAALKDPRFTITAEEFGKLPPSEVGKPYPTITDTAGNHYDVINRPDDQMGVWVQKKGAPNVEYIPFADAKEPASVFKVAVDMGGGKTHEIEVAIALDAKGKPIYSQDDVKKMIAQMPKEDIDALDVLRINGGASRQDAYWLAKGQFKPGSGSAATAGPMSETVATASGHASSQPITKTMADGTVQQKKVIDFYPMGIKSGNGSAKSFADVLEVAHHEMGHLVANKYYGSAVPPKSWEAAIAGDKAKFSSSYAQSNSAEDFAETVAMYMKYDGDASKVPGFAERFKILDDLFKFDGNRAWLKEQFGKSMAKLGMIGVAGVTGVGVVTYEGAKALGPDDKKEEKKEPAVAK
jgi:hypothetical protein